jgi:hypothetical protein
MRLVNLLIAKSIAEALFVAVLAVSFYLTAFNTNLRGWSETGENTIAGWIVDDAAPEARVEVQLYVDDNFVANARANVSRPDIVAAGRARDEWHGFAFNTASLQSGAHVARVYAVHESGGGARRTLQLIGKPVRFVVGANQSMFSDQSLSEKEQR